MKRGKIAARMCIYVVLVLCACNVLLPLYWAVSSSLKPTAEILRVTFAPSRLCFSHYERLWLQTAFPRWLLNSIVVMVGAVCLGVLICSMAGFAFAKYEFPMREVLFWVILASMTLPEFLVLIPLFGWAVRLRLINTYPVLILPMATNAFGVFMMRQYIKGVPDEILDAARIDGATEVQLYLRIVLPIVRPALATSAIFIALHSWNSYVWPLVLMRTEEMYTVPVGLASLQSPYEFNYGLLMAGAVVSVLPMAFMFLLLQKYYIAGLLRGAVK